jgi:hypothetical protein
MQSSQKSTKLVNLAFLLFFFVLQNIKELFS